MYSGIDLCSGKSISIEFEKKDCGRKTDPFVTVRIELSAPRRSG
jgi:hypothetical protein